MKPALRLSPESDEIDLNKLFLSIWAGRYWIAFCAAIGLACGMFYLANTPPTYQADVLLQLEQGSSGGLALPSGLSDFLPSDSRAATEIEIIGSRLIIGQVVADQNLDWQVNPVYAPFFGNAMARYDLPIPDLAFLKPYARKGDKITLELLEVPPEMVGSPIVVIAGTDGAYTLRFDDGTTVEGKVGLITRATDRGVAVKLSALQAPAGREFTLVHLSERRAIDIIRASVTVTERGRQSSILEVRYQNKNGPIAIRTLNAIATAYVRQNIERSAAVAESSLTFINDQLPEAQINLAAAEKALNDYRQEQQSVDLTFETENVLSQVTRIETELRELQNKEDEIKQRYKTSHPIYQQLLAQRLRLQEDLAKLKGEVETLPETQKEVLNLTRDLELSQQIYTELLTRAQEVRVLKASTVGNVRIIDTAEVATLPVAPRSGLIRILALMLGGLVGMAIGLLRAWLRKAIQGTEALEQIGLPVFATINLAMSAEKGGKVRGPNSILALTDPTDLAIEGLRSLRTSLQFGMLDAKTRSLAITSTAPGAGKSFTSLNLAVVTAQTGQSVCLVDTDMRRGQLRKFFGIHKNEPGLSEYLAGEKTLDEVLRTSVVDGLSFIPTGSYPPNPSELLMRHRMDELIAELSTRFEMTILDCPPVLAVTDPVIVGAKAGGVLAVVRYDQTPLVEVQAMLKTCDSAGVRLTGAILNGFDPRKARAGYSYNYNYNYRYEYKSRAD